MNLLRSISIFALVSASAVAHATTQPAADLFK
jgi:hypothetical protein